MEKNWYTRIATELNEKKKRAQNIVEIGEIKFEIKI